MGGGDVGPTQQEKTLASISAAQFQDYSARFLPIQDHLANVVSDMGGKDSWQRAEARGKGNVDAAAMFGQVMQQQTVGKMVRGIQVGSPAFNLTTAGTASAEAQMKGFGVQRGNEAIDRAYLDNLTAITRGGSRLATSAVQGAGPGAMASSREAITADQVSAANTSANMQIAGGILGFAGGAYKTGMFSSPSTGGITQSTFDQGGSYQPAIDPFSAGGGYYQPTMQPGGIR